MKHNDSRAALKITNEISENNGIMLTQLSIASLFDLLCNLFQRVQQRMSTKFVNNFCTYFKTYQKLCKPKDIQSKHQFPTVNRRTIASVT